MWTEKRMGRHMRKDREGREGQDARDMSVVSVSNLTVKPAIRSGLTSVLTLICWGRHSEVRFRPSLCCC